MFGSSGLIALDGKGLDPLLMELESVQQKSKRDDAKFGAMRGEIRTCVSTLGSIINMDHNISCDTRKELSKVRGVLVKISNGDK